MATNICYQGYNLRFSKFIPGSKNLLLAKKLLSNTNEAYHRGLRKLAIVTGCFGPFPILNLCCFGPILILSGHFRDGSFQPNLKKVLSAHFYRFNR